MGRFDSLEIGAPKQEPIVKENNQPFGVEKKGAADFLRIADEEMQLCNFEKALQMFSRTLSFDNKNLSAWFGQVKCLIYLNEFKESILWADKAIETLGECVELLAAKSSAYCRMGDFSRAYGLSDVSMEQKRTNPFIWICRGEILLQQKRKNYSFCFDQALITPGDSWEIMIEIARVYMFYNQPASALIYLELAQEDAPSKALVWYELGNCYASMGLKNKALTSFSRSLEISPNMLIAKNRYKQVEQSGLLSNIRKKLFS